MSDRQASKKKKKKKHSRGGGTIILYTQYSTVKYRTVHEAGVVGEIARKLNIEIEIFE